MTLAEYRGRKVVVLDFWATWCGPCRMAMPGLQAVKDQFKADSPEILSINQGESAAQAGDFMKKRNYDFHVLLDPETAIGAKYSVQGIPTLVVVDKAGVVRLIQVGYSPNESDLKAMVARLTKE